ncbi:MAG: hypothetical protein ACYSWQ_08210 [Planctomycetota bacterium]
MTKRRLILGLTACLLVATSGRRLLSQSRGSGGFAGGSGSQRPRSTRPTQRTGSMRPARMSGRPDFERMKDMSPEEKTKYMQKFFEDQRKAMEEQEALAMKQTLGVDDKQWKVIAPKLKKVRHYREQAFIGTKPPFQSSFSSFGTGPGGGQGGGFGGGGASFQFQAGGGMSGMGGGGMTPMGDPDRPLTDGERIIEELQWLLHDLEPNPTDVRQKMNELRKAREKAAQQWVRAQEDLRKVLDLRQEATLMMMGLLN